MSSRNNLRLQKLRRQIRSACLADESIVVKQLCESCDLASDERNEISNRAAKVVRTLRRETTPGILETFLAEYGLSTDEGVALMCLAEAILRVPDAGTIDALINDKITSSNWTKHLGRSSSFLVNASTWGLLLTGRVLSLEDDRSIFGQLREIVRRLGEPVVRVAVGQVIKELGQQFVLGQTIDEASRRALKLEVDGYTYSYDMLGESATSEKDARKYHLAYSRTITALADACSSETIRQNAGISVKLSALHPRYEYLQHEKVLEELTARCLSLAQLAKSSNMGFNIDAEEADRLDLSLDVIENVLSDPSLANWDGFGIVVQAYGKRSPYVLDWLDELAKWLDRKIMVRLVKGAYWDTEIKRAQVLGLTDYPVFTRKANTDISYLSNARKLLLMRDSIYPQFATHNAHTVESVMHFARKYGADWTNDFEFQRLHGMGESLYNILMSEQDIRCRIYAPVGTHEDLLAYLVRRLLENGANSSFVNQITDKNVEPEMVARDPVEVFEGFGEQISNPWIRNPEYLFGNERKGSKGWDLTDPDVVSQLIDKREEFRSQQWNSKPRIPRKVEKPGEVRPVCNPANPAEKIGSVEESNLLHIEEAINASQTGYQDWKNRSCEDRAGTFEKLADLYEENAYELFALLAREAGKCIPDCAAELREAVDFCRYYAVQCRQFESSFDGYQPRGVIVCISPWNFPLAIFTGQIVAALAAGNAVISKPAEQTPLIASKAIDLMISAGVPLGTIQLLPGDGPTVGAPLTMDKRIAGVCFTGSTEVAGIINRAMAEHLNPDAPLIAETGGLNAMVVDSTALPEQAVKDIIVSSFQSAGQRCSALRVLFIQEDVKDRTLDMLVNAMKSMRVSDPWQFSSDVGPVIEKSARNELLAYCEKAKKEGKLLNQLEIPKSASNGYFVPPAVIEVREIEEIEKEFFGPILHVATYRSGQLNEIVESVNSMGYGLTFGVHTRVDHRVKQIVDSVQAGNIYVNRNQIGAVVGSQPFGGEGLSGTGPKAGGPNYLKRFYIKSESKDSKRESPSESGPLLVEEDRINACLVELKGLQLAQRDTAIENLKRWVAENHGYLIESLDDLWKRNKEFAGDSVELPGPTGESNQLWYVPRGTFVCLGDLCSADSDAVAMQIAAAVISGNRALVVAPSGNEEIGRLESEYGLPVLWLNGVTVPEALKNLVGMNGVVAFGSIEKIRPWRIALAQRQGPILPLITNFFHLDRYYHERTLCIDTTASGGNTNLLASASD